MCVSPAGIKSEGKPSCTWFERRVSDSARRLLELFHISYIKNVLNVVQRENIGLQFSSPKVKYDPALRNVMVSSRRAARFNMA